MSSINVDFEELKKMTAEFVRAMPTLNLEELDNGMKCFGIAYLGCEFPDDIIGNANRNAAAPAIFRIVSKLYMDREWELLKNKV